MRTVRRAILYAIGLFLLAGLVWLQEDEREAAAAARPAGSADAWLSGPTDALLSDSAAAPSDTQGKGDEGDPPMVALTFDDGPHSRYTEELLDGLAARNVKATFFLIGCNVEGKEDLVQRIEEEGHLIGSHTCSHVKLTDLSEEAAFAEITRCNEIIQSVTDAPVIYIRPPYGAWISSWSDELNMKVVLWDVDPEDWKYQNTDTIVRHIVSHVSDGDIILLHDIYQTSVEAALQVVDLLQAEGYQFARIDELLID